MVALKPLHTRRGQVIMASSSRPRQNPQDKDNMTCVYKVDPRIKAKDPAIRAAGTLPGPKLMAPAFSDLGVEDASAVENASAGCAEVT